MGEFVLVGLVGMHTLPHPIPSRSGLVAHCIGGPSSLFEPNKKKFQSCFPQTTITITPPFNHALNN
jgi:hypothetical protein